MRAGLIPKAGLRLHAPAAALCTPAQAAIPAPTAQQRAFAWDLTRLLTVLAAKRDIQRI